MAPHPSPLTALRFDHATTADAPRQQGSVMYHGIHVTFSNMVSLRPSLALFGFDAIVFPSNFLNCNPAPWVTVRISYKSIFKILLL